MNAIELSIFSSRIDAICAEMGVVLQRAAFSPNIKDRLDFSCAVFDVEGQLCAQAAHIPVHLGSMAFAMRDVVTGIDWHPGDRIIFNDPFLGGTHLPDVTLVAPVYVEQALIGFVANRAHHADIGAASPGSMPLSSSLDEEGLVIEPSHLASGGELDQALFQHLTGATQNPASAQGDFTAQLSAATLGVERLATLVAGMGTNAFSNGLAALNDYGERLARDTLQRIPHGIYRFTDYLDDDGQGNTDLELRVAITVSAAGVEVDFSGSTDQVAGNVNCPMSVTAAAVYYVFRCLMPAQTPACAGTLRPITMYAPSGSLLNAERPAAVAAGNVETSTRIVDLLLGALAQALPDEIPAASHGSMNNLAMGSRSGDLVWDYYETIGGGMGAGPHGGGQSAVQTHMTNTLNTPVEVLEMNYPLRVNRYAVRRGSGGKGRRRGGDGVIREFEFLAPTQVTLLSERRRYAPWGLAGGEAGKKAVNLCGGVAVGGKHTQRLDRGQRLSIETAGGGGWGGKE